MRYPIVGTGSPLTSIIVYDLGTTTPSTVYAALTGGSALTDAIVTADENGVFTFFVDDSDYPVVSYFDIYFFASGNTITGVWAFFTDTGGLATADPDPSIGSTVSVLQIYNLALMAVGAAPLATIADVSVQADVVRAWYPYCRDALLRAHPWNFAEKRAALTGLTGTHPVMDYAYFFNLPSDCLKLRKLSDQSVDIPYKLEGRRIACDEPVLSILYTYRITDATYFDTTFVDALVALLAWRISYPIRKDINLAKVKGAEYRAALSIATGVDAQEGTPDVPMSDDLLVVR